MSTDVDVLIVGAGFGGLYALHRARSMGLTAVVCERGDGVGGTWYWNRYPGARCDVESLEYSYQFDEDLQQEWDWTERYAAQPEILAYLNHVADRFELRDGIQLSTTVKAATFDEAEQRWLVATVGKVARTFRPQFLIMATGCLSSTNTPDFPGKEVFAGDTYHTGTWPQEGVDFTGKRVAVIGTGSSAVQSIPIIAQQAADLTVFQRTATYAVPAHNRPADPEEVADIRARYAEFRAANRLQGSAFDSRHPPRDVLVLSESEEEREAEFDRRWNRGGLSFLRSYLDLLLSDDANEIAAEFVRRKIRSIVDDEATAELLCPSQVLGCKRLVIDSGYYETFNRQNVHLVDVSTEPISELTSEGLRVSDTPYAFDAIVFATGFDAMTGALLGMEITGRDGLRLADAWKAGPVNYLGLQIPGFPNLFTVSGPGSPSVLTNMAVSIQQHVEWITDCIKSVIDDGHQTIEAESSAAGEWVNHVNTIADLTLFPSCNSWYLGANIPGKTRVFMPLVGFPDYEAKCNEVAANGYEGFVLA